MTELIERLRAPLSPDLRAEGWTPAAQVDMVEWFGLLLAKVRGGETIDFATDLHAGIARNLDHYGVHSGETLEMAAEASNLLREPTTAD